MEKASIGVSNDFCPQTMFLYGTYKEDGSPNFGLFSWVSYCFDGEIGVMACIGGEKLTRDRIRANKVFSANLVTEAILPLADYLGNTEGYTTGKMDIPIAIEKGQALTIPILADSPWVFELEVTQSVPLDDSEIYICKIRNTLADKSLLDGSVPVAERMAAMSPVFSGGGTHYFGWNGAHKSAWGGLKEQIKP